MAPDIKTRIARIDEALTDLRAEREAALMAWYTAQQGTAKNKALRAYHGVLGAVRELTEQRLKLRRQAIFG